MTIKGMKSLTQKLASMNEVSLEQSRKAIGKNLLRVQADAKRNLAGSVTHSSGELMNSIHVDTKIENNEVIGRVYTTNAHAMYVEFGTGPIGKASIKEIPPGVALQYKDKGWLVPVKYFPDYEQYGMIAIDIKGELFVPTRGQEAQQFMTKAAKKHKAKMGKEISSSIGKQISEDLRV